MKLSRKRLTGQLSWRHSQASDGGEQGRGEPEVRGEVEELRGAKDAEERRRKEKMVGLGVEVFM